MIHKSNHTLSLKCFNWSIMATTINISITDITFRLDEVSTQLVKLCNLPSASNPYAPVGVLIFLSKTDAKYHLSVEMLPQGDYSHRALDAYPTGDTLSEDWWSDYRKTGGLLTYFLGGSLAFVDETILSIWLDTFNSELEIELCTTPFFVLHKTDKEFKRVLVKITL